MKVAIFAPRDEPEEVLARLREAGHTLTFGDPRWCTPEGSDEDALASFAADADILMGGSIRSTPITRRVIESAPRLRAISKYSVGVDDVDVDAATDLGVLVTHAPTEENCFAVAEMTMAMMLALLKRLPQRDAAVKSGGWREQPGLLGLTLGQRFTDEYPGITIGIVGLGRIGTRLAHLLTPWRVHVVAYDPYIEPTRFAQVGVRPLDYRQLLRESDVISFHVVLTRETRHMLAAPELELMKPSAIVINTARGGVIDEDALAAGLRARTINAAALDAFETEPLPPDSPLRQVEEHLLLSPHASHTNLDAQGELRAGVVWAAESVERILRGEIPTNVYNRDAVPAWRSRFA